MADDFTWDIVVRLATQGVSKAKGDVESFVEAVDEMNAAGKVSPKVFDDASKAAARNAKATSDAARSVAEMEKNLPRLRYALYDVSSTLTLAGTAMTALAAGTAAATISMQRSFADVLRTTETFDQASAAALDLRKEFENLFTSMPTSWKDLTDIGTLAGQLNIARDNVAEFTELVAMFAATTDVSVEQAATAFGRLSTLLDVPASEFENLGSSILAVGVNSVATESQIINISSQITSMAATAGFSADQVFGLSAALASLGTQPELSRGVVTRLFTNISKAIAEGGERLDAFGRLAGQTGQEFATAWGDNAAMALLKLMRGLGAVEGSKAVQTLNDLGITAARDVPTILRLAQNNDVLAESLQVAAEGYADGTALQEQYSVITSTVAAKLEVLVNSFQNLVATAGESVGGLGALVDVAIALTNAFTALIDNPVGATIAGLVVAVTALVGVFGLLSGVALRGVAGLVAFRTVMADLTVGGAAASATLASMTTTMTGVAASSGAASVAVRGLGIAIKFAIPILGAIAAAAGIAFQIIGEATKTSKERAEDFFGTLAGFEDAIKADNAKDYAGKVFGEITTKAPEAAKATNEAQAATESWLGIQSQVPNYTGAATEAVTGQTLALGENAQAWILNSLKANEAVQKLATTPEALQSLESVGFKMQDLIAAGLEGDGAIDAFMENLRLKLVEAVRAGEIDPNWSTNVFASVSQVSNALENLVQSGQDTAAVNELLGLSAQGAGEDIQGMSDAAFGALNDLLDLESGSIDLQNSIFDLGNSLAENGIAWDYFSEAGRDNLGALMDVMNAIAAQTPGDAAATANALQGLFDFIVAGGYASAQQLSVLSSAIASLGGATASTTFNPTSFFSGWDKGAQKAARSTRGAGNAARKAAKEVRTLVDYANDLDKVFSRAFDIRFSAGSTLDKITMSFIEMREATEESAQNIRTLKAEIQGLQSDINIQKYFLGIAIEYNDTKRAEAIQANIAKLQAELAGKTADLSDEQSKNSKTLVGNSKAAIENRATLEGLVKQYQDHITALASSGLSQAELSRRTAELRAQFIQQTTEMGYSRTEVEKYAKAFDDMATIIAKVPRNITVTANVNPALQALNEFQAKARSLAGQTYSGGTINPPSVNNDAAAKAVRLQKLQSEAATLNARLLRGDASPSQWTNWLARLDQIAKIIASGGYASGGFTGRGGRNEPAGIVHRGEYVVPKHQVNQSTGLPYANALGSLQRGASGPGYANGGFVGRAPSLGPSQIASFGPMAQQQMAQLMAQYMRVYLDGQTVSTNSAAHYAQETYTGAY